MTEQQLLAAVDNFAEDFRKAERRFSQQGQSLSERAKRTSLKLTDINKARQFIDEGITITRDYFVACEAIIFALDALAKPMLENGLTARAAGAVADLMKKITKDMDESSTSFTVSFNGVHLGEAGTVMPKPGIQAKTVQLFWEQQYKTMPGYAEEEARRKAAAEQKKQAEKQAAEEARKAADAMQAQIAKRRQDSEAVLRRRNALQKKCDDALEAYNTAAQKAVQELRPTLRKQNEQAAAKLDQQIAKLKKTRASGEERRKLKEQIARLEAEAAVLTSDAFLQKQLLHCEVVAEEYVERYSKQLDAHMAKCYTEKTVTDSYASGSAAIQPSSASMDSQKEEILDILRSTGWATVSQIAVQMYGALTNQRIAALLRQMMTDGLVSRVEQENKAFFGIPGTPFRSSTTVWVENEKTANSPLPTPPAVTFRESDYTCHGHKEVMVDGYLDAIKKKNQSRKRTVRVVIAVLCAIAIFTAYGVISAKNEKQRLVEVTQLAEEQANLLLQDALNNYADWVKENGVTEISATVQEVIFVPKKYLLYDYQKPHYLIKLRIECTATDVLYDEPEFLAGDITDAMPGSFGEVDGYRVYLRSESIKDSDKLYGGAPYELNSKTMVYIYINGRFVQGPRI